MLLGEGVGYRFEGQMNCDSFLTVMRQSGHNRTFTCQVVNVYSSVFIEAEYTPDFTDDVLTGTSNPGKNFQNLAMSTPSVYVKML